MFPNSPTKHYFTCEDGGGGQTPKVITIFIESYTADPF
jgi:hypothetical protein